ncbi:MAG: hypothetical protein CL431_04965 [Acidimicrobiaceae bacterium]|jgi:hypothetical protein|nr:hypothetical protein [Acidimicrobiaceae bacterium]|tara:strand:+ start:47640 stop:47996 length:357 start_codon:yes stop_codon:yes gene_type:complete
MAQVENWDQAKNELRDAIEKIFIPIKLIDDNDDPSIPAIFAVVGFGLFVASAYLFDQHWSFFIIFLIATYLIATKTVLGKIVFYSLKSIMWFPIIAGVLLYNVCVAIPLFKYRSRSTE